MHLWDSWSRIKTTAIVFSSMPPVKVRSSQCRVSVEVLAPGILPSSVLFPAGWALSSPCDPAPYLSLLSVVPLGAQRDLTVAFNLHLTDDWRAHTSVYTASADPFCKVFISSVHSFIKFPYWFLSKFFIVMCEMMNPLWNLWVINIFSTSVPYIVLMVFSGKWKVIILTVWCSHWWLNDRVFRGV